MKDDCSSSFPSKLNKTIEIKKGNGESPKDADDIVEAEVVDDKAGDKFFVDNRLFPNDLLEHRRC